MEKLSRNEYEKAGDSRNKAARLEGWLSIVINILLFALKYWAGVVSMSIALIADAWHTLSDSISSVIVLISAKISSKPPDKDHPYGHGRAELIASMLIGVLLAIVSVEFIHQAVDKFHNQETAEYGTIAIVVTLISIILKELLARYSFHFGKKHQLSTLIADGQHHRSDALSSIVVMIGIIAGSRFWWMDSLLGILVAIMIGYAAYRIFIESADRLLGRCADKELRTEVMEICEEVAQSNKIELHPHHFHVHQYGEHKELTFHVRMPKDWEIGFGHEILIQIENILRDRLRIEATIHIDPN
ncbi:MAG: cation diffusion facilitator family transporter [Candidatus Stygibacter frigidus]|nr:cation diffusion facilitator family transporter [Candidatus Stygibacter frigidus]